MCNATRTTKNREIKSLIPFLSSSTTVVSGGEVSCLHWWRNPKQSGNAWGFTIGSLAIPLRIIMFTGSLALILAALKKGETNS